ncbi:MAG: sulfatase-like hydrolase/transferase, partial [Candidatus Hermodarchaeia archaeon]
WVSRKLRNPANVIKFFNIFGIALILLPVSTIISHQLEGSKDKLIRSGFNPGIQPDINRISPDIYYIILDGYARADILEEIYGYDNSDFVNYLQERGFYVAEKSCSNYNQTASSLASSLSLDYVNDLSKTMASDSKNRQPLANKLKFSVVSELLDSRGYEVVAFETGYERTELKNADHYWSLESEVVPQITSLWRFNAFESLLLESTMFRIVFDLYFLSPDTFLKVMLESEFQAHRERILYAFERLDDIAKMEGNHFVFAHLISPHPPFVFGPQGEAINPKSAYRIADGDFYPGDINEYMNGYKDQLSFINVQAMKVIDRILTRSDTPPIIILQSDHGPGAYLIWDSAEKTNLKERYGILNAYYFPDGNYDELYPSITPVNSFRLVLNSQFGTDIELLQDESYFAPWMRPYDFVRVTDRINCEQN